jgi:hypothetical protein
LHDKPVRWFETRSRADLDGVLTGLACPIVLIDLGRHPAAALLDLELVVRRASDARVLVLDPESHNEVAGLACELGATHVASGFVPPPVVAALMARWIISAESRIGRDGWSRNAMSDSEMGPWGWLASYLGESDRFAAGPALQRGPAASKPAGDNCLPPPSSLSP